MESEGSHWVWGPKWKVRGHYRSWETLWEFGMGTVETEGSQGALWEAVWGVGQCGRQCRPMSWEAKWEVGGGTVETKGSPGGRWALWAPIGG